MQPSTIRFHVEGAFSGQTGLVDHDECVVHGVSLITGQMEAEGHDLEVDDTTTSQLHTLAKECGQVPVYLDHGAGIKELNGYIDNFSMDGVKLRGDWHLLKTHDETRVMLERAERQPKTFGLSVAFKGKGVATKGGKKAARAEKLLSADVVPRPAANKGLFAAKESQLVDTNKNSMNETPEPTLADVVALLQKLDGRLTEQEKSHKELVEAMKGSQNEPSDYDILSALHNASDEELAANNLTRAEVDAAVAEYNATASGEPEGGDTGDGGEGTPQPGQQSQSQTPAMAGNVSGGAETTTAMRAMERDIIALKNKIAAQELKAKREAEEIQFAEIEENTTILAAQRDEAIKLAEKMVAENEALKLAVRTGTRPVKAGVDNEVRLFSANGEGQLHEFQKRVKALETEQKLSTAQALQLAIRENPGLHADWLQSGQSNTIHA